MAKLLQKKQYSGVALFRVNYDTQKDVMKQLGVRERSSLIMFKGAKEVGRSTGHTEEMIIEELLDKGVK